MEQSYLKTDEVFVYRIPPMMTSGGHRADDWNLAKPLASCSLHVKRRDDDLFLQLYSDRPKVGGPPGSTEQHLFAQSRIVIRMGNDEEKKQPMEHWVEAVTDSSRYFVIRISDAKTGREALIGMGFRERTDATNFKMCLQEYENALKKDQKAQQIHSAYESSNNDDDNNTDDPKKQTDDLPDDSFSKLSLKEGEKIHIKIKGMEGVSRPSKSTKPSSFANSSKSGLPVLIRKPPSAAGSTTSNNKSPNRISMETKSPIVIDTNKMVEYQTRSRPRTESVASVDISSTIAVTEIDELNDDEWGEFESSH